MFGIAADDQEGASLLDDTLVVHRRIDEDATIEVIQGEGVFWLELIIEGEGIEDKGTQESAPYLWVQFWLKVAETRYSLAAMVFVDLALMAFVVVGPADGGVGGNQRVAFKVLFGSLGEAGINNTEGVGAIYFLQGEEEGDQRVAGDIEEARWAAVVLQFDKL